MQWNNPETKVGFFTLLALLAMFFLFLWLNGSQLFERGHEVEAIFTRIEGVRPGAPVKFSGVDIGRVTRIYFEDFNVVVVMRIRSDFKVPRAAKAVIASSGVVGDMFIEIMPYRVGETIVPMRGNRLTGQNPIAMDQFYNTAYEVIASLQQITDSIRGLTENPEVIESLRQSLVRLDTITKDISHISGQLEQLDYPGLVRRMDNTMLIVERLAAANEPRINTLIENISLASVQLTQASITANRFLKDIDADGETAADLQQTLAHAEQVAADLEKLSSYLASHTGEIDQLFGDAHQTMQSIDRAAVSINQAVTQLTSGEGGLSDIKQIIDQTGTAADKITRSVNSLSQVSLQSSIGLGYHQSGFGEDPQDQGLTAADLRMDLHLNQRDSLVIGVEDIGGSNSSILQWAFTGAGNISRIGLYKNQFGLGIDWLPASNLSLGLNLWDTHSANLGLTSTLKISPYWSVSLGGATNLESRDYSLDLELWRNF